jgi:hypothetical protein
LDTFEVSNGAGDLQDAGVGAGGKAEQHVRGQVLQYYIPALLRSLSTSLMARLTLVY